MHDHAVQFESCHIKQKQSCMHAHVVHDKFDQNKMLDFGLEGDLGLRSHKHTTLHVIWGFGCRGYGVEGWVWVQCVNKSLLQGSELHCRWGSRRK